MGLLRTDYIHSANIKIIKKDRILESNPVLEKEQK